MVNSKLASGALAIVDTPYGERFRFQLSKTVRDLQATVIINRAGSSEKLPLDKTKDSMIYQSSAAPEEPHEFTATLVLKSKAQTVRLPFELKESEGHHHI